MAEFRLVPVDDEKPSFTLTPVEDEGDGTALDILKSGASGVGRGIADLAGLPGTLSNAFNSGMSWLTGLPQLPSTPGDASDMRSVASTLTAGGTDYEPKTTAGDYASTIGEFLPGAATMGLNPGSLLRFGVLPAAASETAGQATEGTAAEPYARIAAALAAPAAVAGASRAITPFQIPAGRSEAAAVLRNEGVNPTAGQVTGSKGLRYAESELGGSRAAQMAEDQAEAFTSAAMRRAGGEGRATPENMTAIRDRLSQGFDDISARNAVSADQALVTDMNKTLKEYMRVLPTEQKQIVRNLGDDIAARFKAGQGRIPGQDYQTIRSRLSRMAQNNKQRDPEFAEALRGMRRSLDEAMARSVSPDDAAEWARLRREYGNMKVLEKAAVGGGEDAAMGLISPARLRMAASSGNKGGYARGEGDFAELARAGQSVLTPLPNSGTAGRLRAQNLGAGVLAGGGALAGGLPGMVAGLVAPAAAGRALMSRPVQSYLANELLSAPKFADARYAAIVQALLSRGDGQQKRLGSQ